MNRIKLLHLISRINIGGAERQLLNLVSCLDKEKYDICVGYFEGKGELRKGFQKAGVEIKKFRFMGFWDISMWWKLYQYMRINRFDIVHTHGFKADLGGAIVGRLARVPVVISTDVHGAFDLIQDNKRDILIKRKNVKGIVEAVRYLVYNPNGAKKWGKRPKD